MVIEKITYEAYIRDAYRCLDDGLRYSEVPNNDAARSIYANSIVQENVCFDIYMLETERGYVAMELYVGEITEEGMRKRYSRIKEIKNQLNLLGEIINRSKQEIGKIAKGLNKDCLEERLNEEF